MIGPDQRIGAYDALRSITTWAAFQAFQENSKGSVRVGKLADLVILDRNPLKMEPQALRDLKVGETITRAKTIFPATNPR